MKDGLFEFCGRRWTSREVLGEEAIGDGGNVGSEDVEALGVE